MSETKSVGKVFRETMVNRVKQGVEKKDSTFLLSYSGVSGPQMNALRKGLKQVGADFYVSKKSIAQIALKNLKFDKLAERASGQTAFVWTDTDSSEVSKALIKFTKECKGLLIQGGLLQGQILEKSDIERLSDLPAKPILISQLLGTMQSPLTRLAGALNGKTRDLLSLLKQLSEKKGGS